MLACAIFSNTLRLTCPHYSPRGDGFPLANMLALVSIDSKDLIPVLTAHIYTVCPTAIPTLPTPSPDASEEELMQSLGMLKGKNGEFETFERFLARTEVRGTMLSVTNHADQSFISHAVAVSFVGRYIHCRKHHVVSTRVASSPGRTRRRHQLVVTIPFSLASCSRVSFAPFDCTCAGRLSRRRGSYACQQACRTVQDPS
jgi:hypothetical protein